MNRGKMYEKLQKVRSNTKESIAKIYFQAGGI